MAHPFDCAVTGQDDAPSSPAPAALDGVLGGTLALMSHYARTPNFAAADKIARNLALLARHPGASDGLQTLCTRLFVEWLGPLHTQDQPPSQHWRTVQSMPGPTQ